MQQKHFAFKTTDSSVLKDIVFEQQIMWHDSANLIYKGD